MSDFISVSIGSNIQGETPVRRSVLAEEEIVDTPAQGVHTLYDVLQYCVKRRADNHAMGYRKVEKIVTENKEITKMVDGVETKQTKSWKYFQLSPYHYVTYAEFSQMAHDIGAGLIHYGLKEKSRIEIFAPTSMDWMSIAHGAFTQNIAIVTAYETLGHEGLLHSMNEAEVEAIFTSAELLKILATVLPDAQKKVSLVVYTGEAKPEDLKKIQEVVGQDCLVSLDQLKTVGQQHPTKPNKPGRDDLCCVMYTSGSTGAPKGVILNHSNLVGAIAGVDTLLGHIINDGEDYMMAYLPLAHVLEFLVENLCLFWGVVLGYGSPRTLTDTSVRNCKGDIKEFRPTLMTGVPAVWESIRKGVLANVAKMSPAAQAIFHRAFATKSWLMERGLPSGFLDTMVFNKVKEQVGGRFRLGLAGGAPLALETQKFLSVTLNPILNGYDWLIFYSMCCIMAPEHFSLGSVGGPVPCCEIKLVDVPEANYLSTNEKPQGEIWVRGSPVTKGYFKQDELTNEAITEDGWLRTGDVGEWNSDGSLSVIDRIKNLVKLSHGEYIALEKLESVYKTALGVGNICVYGDSLRPRPVAIVMPIRSGLEQLASRLDIHQSFEELCDNEDIKKAFLVELQKQGNQAGLKPVEIVHDVYLTHEEWSSENGLLTAAQKLKRNAINKQYKEQLDA
ncbi:long-chain fatty acid-CoA ligase, partial [Rhizopus stolonifer]